MINSSADDTPGTTAPATAAPPTTAGGLLRQARQAQGMHIAALAAAIKVTPRKLELLEADQLDQLPDPAFARALAQAVCRALKVDPAPVLALLPRPAGREAGLEHVSGGLRTPFREGGMHESEGSILGSPVFWIAALLVIASVVVFFMPSSWLRLPGRDATPTAASGVVGDAVMPPGGLPGVTVTEGVTTTVVPPSSGGAPGEGAGGSAAPAAGDAGAPGAAGGAAGLGGGGATGAGPAAAGTAGAGAGGTAGAGTAGAGAGGTAGAGTAGAGTAGTAGAGAAGALVFSPTQASWVEVVDATGTALVSRTLAANETLALNGTPPFKVRIGNAAGTTLTYKGQPVDLSKTRDNTVRMELK